MRHHTPSTPQAQHCFIQSQRVAQNCQSIFNLLTSEGLFNEVEARLPEHRERLFPPTETLALFITQALSADRSCQYAVNQAAIHRLVSGLPICSTQIGGYRRARQRLPTDLVSGLARYVGQQIDEQLPDKWRGRRVPLVDGTTVALPDTPEHQAAYPQQRAQEPGLGFPICRPVGITCLASGALLNAAVGRFQGKGGDEQTLLRSIQDTFEPGDLVLGDAFFPPFFLIAAIYEAAPETLTVREFKAGGKITVTTLLCPKEASKTALKALYEQRWGVELDIRSIKDTMGMDVLSCKTPEMAHKEIGVYLYNLLRLLMAQAAFMADTVPRKISFKHC